MGEGHSSLPQLVDETILTTAFEAARPRLLAMVQRRVGPGLLARVDVEGVLHNAYLRAHQKWQGVGKRPPPAGLYCWVYRVVRDQAIDEIRAALGPCRDANREQPWPDEAVARIAVQLVGSETGPGTAAEHKGLAELGRAAVARLKHVDREVVSMRYFDGLTLDEVGAVLGMTGNAANVRCVRALLKLRTLLGRGGRGTG